MQILRQIHKVKFSDLSLLFETLNLIANLLDCILEHGWDQTSQIWRRQFQARVRVHFDQPRLQLLVDHKVVPEDLEGAVATVGVNLA